MSGHMGRFVSKVCRDCWPPLAITCGVFAVGWAVAGRVIPVWMAVVGVVLLLLAGVLMLLALVLAAAYYIRRAWRETR